MLEQSSYTRRARRNQHARGHALPAPRRPSIPPSVQGQRGPPSTTRTTPPLHHSITRLLHHSITPLLVLSLAGICTRTGCFAGSSHCTSSIKSLRCSAVQPEVPLRFPSPQMEKNARTSAGFACWVRIDGDPQRVVIHPRHASRRNASLACDSYRGPRSGRNVVSADHRSLLSRA